MRPPWMTDETIDVLKAPPSLTKAPMFLDMGPFPPDMVPQRSAPPQRSTSPGRAAHASLPVAQHLVPVVVEPLDTLSQPTAQPVPAVPSDTPTPGRQPSPRTTPTPQNDALKNKKVYQPIKIEPKTFFANERTFMNWLSHSVLLVTLSLGVMSFATTVYARIAGISLAGVGIIIALYALTIFHWRATKIKNRHATAAYSDRFGPTMLVILIVLAILGNIALQALLFRATTAVFAVSDGVYCTQRQIMLPQAFQPNDVVYHHNESKLILSADYSLYVVPDSGSGVQYALPNIAVKAISLGQPNSPIIYLAVADPVSAPANQIMEYNIQTGTQGRSWSLDSVLGSSPVLSAIAFVPDGANIEGGTFFVNDGNGGIMRLQIPLVTVLSSAPIATAWIPVSNLFSPIRIALKNATADNLAYDNTQNQLYVLASNANLISVYSLNSNQVVTRLTTPGSPLPWQAVYPLSANQAGPTDVVMVTDAQVWEFSGISQGSPMSSFAGCAGQP